MRLTRLTRSSSEASALDRDPYSRKARSYSGPKRARSSSVRRRFRCFITTQAISKTISSATTPITAITVGSDKLKFIAGLHSLEQLGSEQQERSDELPPHPDHRRSE